MEKFELTKEELLEFAKMATFHLDDRLQPFSREQLRAEAWVEGYLFARSHQPVAEQEPAPIDGLSGAGMILDERNRQIVPVRGTTEADRSTRSHRTPSCTSPGTCTESPSPRRRTARRPSGSQASSRPPSRRRCAGRRDIRPRRACGASRPPSPPA